MKFPKYPQNTSHASHRGSSWEFNFNFMGGALGSLSKSSKLRKLLLSMDADAPMIDTAPGSPCNFCRDNCIVDFIKCGQCAISIHLDCASKWVANKFRNVLANESQCYGEICEETLGQAADDFTTKGVKCTTCNKEKTIDVVRQGHRPLRGLP